VSLFALAAVWVVPGPAAAQRGLYAIILGAAYMPYTVAVAVASRRSDGPLVRLAHILGDIFLIFIFHTLMPATRLLSLCGYLLVVTLHSFLGGRIAGLTVGAGTMALVLVGERFVSPADRLDAYDLFMYAALLALTATVLDLATKEQRKANRRLAALHDSLRIASSSLHLDEVFEAITSSMRDSLGAVSTSIVLATDAGDKAPRRGILADIQGLEPSFWVSGARAVEAPLPVRPAAIAMRLGRPVVVQDTETDPRCDTGPPGATAYRSLVATPLMVGGEPIGAICASFHRPGQAGVDAEDIVRLYADQAASAIGRSISYRRERQAMLEVQRVNDSLERRVRERTLELEEATRSLERTNAELQVANKDLEGFSYSVSHDLRAPLRAVHGFCRLLKEEHSSALTPEATHCVDRVTENARYMGQLVDDLLAFSRLGRKPIQREPVMPEHPARAALTELREEMDRRTVDITIADLPQAHADPNLLKQVFVNLLSNALKFTRQQELAVIEVGASRTSEGDDVYFVRDNGAGFDMRYYDKLFGVFQRLHRQEDYEGTGVGLAIVRRLVERHGGRIWAEASPGAGATFFFTLGDRPSSNGKERADT
jgi:signal transduction histidine kinase